MTITTPNELNSTDIIQHDPEQMKRFLKALDPEAQKFSAGTIIVGGGSMIARDQTVDEVVSDAARRNDASSNTGYYVTINETKLNGGRKAKDIVRVRGVFIDVDGKVDEGENDLPTVEALLKDFPISPSAVIESSPGKRQIYWFVQGHFALDKFTKIQKALINHFGTDKQICDLPRVMRLPGTLHMKGAPFLVRIKELHDGRRYTYRQIVEALVSANSQRGALVSQNGSGGTQTAEDANAHQRASNVIGAIFPKRAPTTEGSELSANITRTNRNVFDFDKARSAGRWLAEQGKLDDRADWRDYWLFPLTHEAKRFPDLEPQIREVFDEVCKYSATLAAGRGVEKAATWDDGNDAGWRNAMRGPMEPNDRAIGSTYMAARDVGWRWTPTPQSNFAGNFAGNGALMTANVTPFPVPVPSARPELGFYPPIQPGYHDRQDAKRMFEERYVLLNHGGEASWHCCTSDGLFVAVQEDSIERLLSNVYIKADKDTPKPTKLFKFMKDDPDGQRALTPVFKPDGVVAAHEFNMWRGFGVERQAGTDKVKPLLRHVWQVICKRDKTKFKYLMRWVADAVQHPDRRSGVAVILQSTMEGTGKSTLSDTLRKIFGEHGRLEDTSEGLLTKFNSHFEFCSYVAVEEVSFAGNHSEADQLKSRLTSPTLNVEGKFRAVREVPNRLHAVITTNHEWPVQAGDGARRWFICEVSPEKAGDKDWFTMIYDGLKAGGYGQFLNLLLNIKLGDFNPLKDLVRTAELAKTQRMTAGTLFDWLMTSAEQGLLVGGGMVAGLKLEEAHSLNAVYERHCAWVKGTNGRPERMQAFKNRIGKVLGAGANRRGATGKREWLFPDGEKLRKRTLEVFNIHGGGEED